MEVTSELEIYPFVEDLSPDGEKLATYDGDISYRWHMQRTDPLGLDESRFFILQDNEGEGEGPVVTGPGDTFQPPRQWLNDDPVSGEDVVFWYVPLLNTKKGGPWWCMPDPDPDFSPCEAILGFRFYEVGSYYTLVPTTCVSQELIMNKRAWERLPADIQEQIMSVSGEHAAIRYGGGCFDRAWDQLPKVCKKEGYTMNTYTPPQEEIDRWIEVAGKPLWQEWVKKMEARGFKSASQIQAKAIELVKEYKQGKTDTWKELFD